MTKKPTPSSEARDLRALLETVVEALTLPRDLDAYDTRILRRASLVRVLVRETLTDGPDRLGWNLDYLRQQLAQEDTEAAEREKNKCRRCGTPFNPADTAFDGRARHNDSPWCRRCVDICGDGGTEHVCVICDPQRYGGGQ
ncbi:hypothetical protein [Streptomyces sp. NPDC002845]